MERTVPVRSSEEIELYLRTIYSLLRSSTEVQIRSLEEAHQGMGSSLHTLAREQRPDLPALSYTLLRLPECILQVERVILGQNLYNFREHGLEDVEQWQEVAASGRRRRSYFDGKNQLAAYIANRSDIDDIVPMLTALQIEWNKIFTLLQGSDATWLARMTPADHEAFTELAARLASPIADLERLAQALGSRFGQMLLAMAARPANFKLRLLSGSLNDYRRATQDWWENVEANFPQLRERPVYFVSSNTHSLPNLLSAYAGSIRPELEAFLQTEGQEDLLQEWEALQTENTGIGSENFYNYVLKRYLASEDGDSHREAITGLEAERGIVRVPSLHSFDVEASIIDLAKLDPESLDPRLLRDLGPDARSLKHLRNSNALILNIDFPLGFAAYNLLTKIAENVPQFLGMYIMGKAGSLNGVRGDVILPSVVYDEHSRNTYLFNNNFSSSDITPWLTYGTVLDNQKAVSVLGTFLQNAKIMNVVYREGYTDIEMEAGPYLSAIYELYRPQRHPVNEIVDLHRVPFDLGILHYVSDTPLTQGRTLAAGNLSYYGMDSTYAVSVAILRRIFALERARQAGMNA